MYQRKLYEWVELLKAAITVVTDERHSGRLSSSGTDVNVCTQNLILNMQSVNVFIIEDTQIILLSVAAIVRNNYRSAQALLCDDMSYSKVRGRWVLCRA